MPRTVLEKRLHALAKQLPGVAAGEVEAIHQARVASRRIREVLPILSAAADDDEARRLRRLVRRVTRALGRLRELDVSLGVLSEFTAGRRDLAPAVEAAQHRLGEDRRAAHARAVQEIGALDMGDMRDSAVALADVAGGRAGIRRCRTELARRIGTRARALDAAVEAAGLLYAAERVHAVRIAAKKLRYALEIAGELRGVGVATSLARLKSLQDLLGRLHDLEVVAALVRDSACSGPGLGAPCERLAEAVDAEIRRLHGQFLEKRETVDAVLRQCRRTRLQVAPPVCRMASASGRTRGRLASGE